MHLRRMRVLLLLGGVFCRCLLDLVGYSVVHIFCCLVDLLPSCSTILESGVLTSPTVVVELSVSPFLSVFALCTLGFCCLVHICLQLLCLLDGLTLLL